MQQPQQTVDSSDFITMSQAARMIPSKSGRPLAPSTIYRWCKRGKLTLYRSNGYKVSRTEIISKFSIRRVHGRP